MAVRSGGSPFSARRFADNVERALAEGVKGQLRERFGAIRHPVTGEFPTVVVRGNTLDDLRLHIEGAPELLEIVGNRMTEDERTASTLQPARGDTPKAFLSFSFDDHGLAEKVARGLMTHGVDTWWAEWEIRSGDSLRQKIDQGLEGCTHFVVLLSPSAKEKPWVRQEMDAGLVRRIAGQARFIVVRNGLSVRDLPPLLSGMLSPELDETDLDESIRDLANDIHGITSKPAIGSAPVVSGSPKTSYSDTATALAAVFVKGTQRALFGDPQKGVAELARSLDVFEDDVADALYELRDMVTVTGDRVLPKETLFVAFDKHFTDWDPEADGLRIAADLVNDKDMPQDTGAAAERYGWSPRRMNPALAWLVERRLLKDCKTISSDYVTFRVLATDGTRRYVRNKS